MSILSLQLVQKPVVEPVTLALAKSQCRVDFTDDDAYFGILIAAAREYAERYTRRAFYNQTWKRTLDNFPIWFAPGTSATPADRENYPYFAGYWDHLTIDLPKMAAVSVTSITYVDLTGTQQTLDPSTYIFDPTSQPARLVPAAGSSWPVQATYVPGSVAITWVAGSYGDGVTVDTCPFSIKQAMLLMIGHWYRNREAVSDVQMARVPLAVNDLLDQHKLQIFNYR